jgi:hypothetical protein
MPITNALVFMAIWFFIGCVAVAIGFQVVGAIAGLASMVSPTTGVSKKQQRYRTVSMRVREYDEDEDY